jgi:hypothetical protein
MTDGYVLVMGNNAFYYDWKLVAWPRTMYVNHKGIVKSETPSTHTPTVKLGTYSAEVVRVEYIDPELKLLAQGKGPKND